MNGKLTAQVVQRVVPGLALAAALGAVGFATSRASDKDVKANADEIKTVKEDVDDLKLNVALTCQFLSRQDKLAGGPGLDCKVPR